MGLTLCLNKKKYEEAENINEIIQILQDEPHLEYLHYIDQLLQIVKKDKFSYHLISYLQGLPEKFYLKQKTW